MKVTTSAVPLTKRFPLTLSRGTSADSDTLLVTVEHDGITGYGEMAPFNIGYGDETAESARVAIQSWAESLHDVAPWQMRRGEAAVPDHLSAPSDPTPNPQPPPPAFCPLDFALHD